MRNFEKKWRRRKFLRCFSLYCITRARLALRLCVIILILILARVTLHLRIANQLGEDSYCRGGIVNTRCGCCCALLEQPKSSTALWRFRVSTSNSPSGRAWPIPNTQNGQIDHNYSQQDIRVYEDDHFQQPKRQYVQGALASSCKYLRHSR